MGLRITKYNADYEKIWDEFVENNSINGCFLQEWKFLNYHGKDRFEDNSLLFYEKEKLVAVCPGCVVLENGEKVFYSHKGSTYGGVLFRKEYLRIEKIKELFQSLEDWLLEQGFSKIVLKLTMDVLCEYPQNVLKFYLKYNGYEEEQELNFYIDYSHYNKDILSNFSKMKKRNVKKGIDVGMKLSELNKIDEIKRFHDILTKNLLKYGVKPVHTVEELLDLKMRLGDNIKFYGAFLENKMLAGTMVFLFDKQRCAHTQYLASDSEYKQYNPMAFIYYKMAEMYCEKEYKYLSWGTATEHGGNVVNWGLANNKEEFGSVHMINSVFMKELEIITKKD